MGDKWLPHSSAETTAPVKRSVQNSDTSSKGAADAQSKVLLSSISWRVSLGRVFGRRSALLTRMEGHQMLAVMSRRNQF